MLRDSSGKTGFTDKQFIDLWESTGGRAKVVAEKMGGLNLRGVYKRRNNIEKRHKIKLPSGGEAGRIGRGDAGGSPIPYNPRLAINGLHGRVVVFSDAHFWNGWSKTPAYKGLLNVIRELKPKVIVANGDVLDGAKISRFPPDGWDKRPRMADELEEVKERMAEIRHAYRGARTVRTIGNHDTRFDRHLAVNSSEFEGIYGFRLKEHLPAWEETISLFINRNCMVKHRFHGGIHSSYNNTLRAGTSIVTGHTHLLEVKPWSDYRGRRYGVSTGTIADINGPQFAYTEDNPTNWCSGFAVLNFDRDGNLLYPELAEVIDGRCYFRGEVIAR